MEPVGGGAAWRDAGWLPSEAARPPPQGKSQTKREGAPPGRARGIARLGREKGENVPSPPFFPPPPLFLFSPLPPLFFSLLSPSHALTRRCSRGNAAYPVEEWGVQGGYPAVGDAARNAYPEVGVPAHARRTWGWVTGARRAYPALALRGDGRRVGHMVRRALWGRPKRSLQAYPGRQARSGGRRVGEAWPARAPGRNRG